MSDAPTPLISKINRGAFVQLVDDVVAPIPNIVTFQFNPEKLTRSLTPFNAFERNEGQNLQAPDAQPFDPEEKISFSLNLSATEGLTRYNPVTMGTGVASRIAALRYMVKPSSGSVFNDIGNSAKALKNLSDNTATRKTLPLTFLVYGPGLILPVRITSFSVEEKLHTPLLYAHEATVTVDLVVITPDQFKCRDTKGKALGIAAYHLTQLQEDALVAANISNSAEDVLDIFI